MSRAELITKLGRIVGEHADAIACAYLHGSAARGEDRDDSDIDVAVLYRETPPSTLEGMGFDIAGEIERAVRRRADVTVLNRAPVDLVHRVLRDGVLLYEGDHHARVLFEVDRRAAYFDLLPYLREYRRAVGGVAR